MAMIQSFVCLVAVLSAASAVKKMINPNVRICKRDDPQLTDCFKENLVKLLPLMNNGLPEMNIAPIEPVHVKNVRMDFPQTQSVRLTADLADMRVWGISKASLNDVTITRSNNTFVMYLDLSIPKITMESNYKAVGKFLLLLIDANGNFTGDFRELRLKTNWTSSLFIKKEQPHFLWKNEVKELTIKKMSIQFNNLFGNNTELTENTNNIINENIDSLYDEISPVVKETINSVATNTVNNVYNLFSLDVLFPKS